MRGDLKAQSAAVKCDCYLVRDSFNIHHQTSKLINMKPPIKICLAQLNFLVGDISGNAEKIISAANQAASAGADLILFPELALSGYPPEDLLFRDELYQRIKLAIEKIKQEAKNIYLVFGYPEKIESQYFNKAICIYNGIILADYSKQCLPNYTVFDEKRYFESGKNVALFVINQKKFALTICEDCWFEAPVKQAKEAGAEVILCLNASPFSINKSALRIEKMQERIQESGLPIIYVNLIGGQDELVFDGGSMILNESGEVIYQAKFFEETTPILTLEFEKKLQIAKKSSIKLPSVEASVYAALALGVRDYVLKNHFKKTLVGLSGGIDSALTLAIAVDALGKENVTAILMPSRYTADISIEDAVSQAKQLGVEYQIISIEQVFETYLNTLKNFIIDKNANITQQNLQSRIRGMILMALSNQTGALVLSTGNRSEMAVGYATLYGDMVGGFCVLKDVPKTLVYRLANYRNQLQTIIPTRVIKRAPTAELAPNQTDQDDLPSYEILDEIIKKYIDEEKSKAEIIAGGIDEKVVEKIIKRINQNEYKRRQAPPGVRISERAFGKDRRYPITNGF